MKKVLLAATAMLAVSAFAGTASAADIAPPPAFDWTGFYLGVNGGYAFGTAEASGNYDGIGRNIENGDFDLNGFTGGGQIGYNWQSNSWVLGVETDLQYAGMNDRNSNIPGDDSTSRATVSTNWFGTGRLRAGYAMDNLLIYGTGGLSYGDVKYDIDDYTGGDGAGQGSDSKVVFGWTAGGGVEYAFDSNWSMRAEYLYVDLGDHSFSPSNKSFDADVNTKFNVVRAAVNYRFP